MPTIPTLKENQRLNPGRPSGFQDSSNARLSGEAVADMGKAIANFSHTQKEKDKDDPTMRALVIAKTKKQAEAEASKLHAEYSNASIEDRGDTFNDDYERKMAEHKSTIIAQTPDEYKRYADQAYDIQKLDDQTKVFDIAGKQKAKYEKNAIDTVFAETYNSVKMDPTKYEAASLEASILHDGLVQSGKLSPERMADNKRAIGKKLTDSAIDGWVSRPKNDLDVGLFDNADKVLEQNKALYTEDEFQKRKEQVQTAKYSFLDRTWKLTDRAEKMKEKAFTEKQNAEMDQTVTDIYENQHDPLKLGLLQNKLLDQIKNGKAKYIRERAFKSLKMSSDIRDDAMSSEVSDLIGMNPTRETATQVFDMLNTALAENQITPTAHKYWQNYVRYIMDKNKNDPNYSKKMSAVMAQLQADYKIGNIDNLTDLDSANTKAFMSAKAQVIKNSVVTGDPFKALDMQRGSYFQQQRSMGAPQNYPYFDLTGEAIKDKESLQKAKNYVMDAPGMSQNEKRRRMKDLKKIEDSLNAKQRLDSKYYDTFKHETDNLLPGNDVQIPLKR